MRVQYRLGVVVCTGVLAGCSPSLEHAGFTQDHLALATFNLRDIGCADANADGRLDLFTVNHSARQSLALNNGPAGFQDVLTAWTLDQDADFPGFAMDYDEPEPTRPGLYVNWRGPDLVVRAHRLPTGQGVSGATEMLTTVKLHETDGFSIDVKPEQLPSGATRTRIEFSGAGDGHFAVRPDQDAVPIDFRLAPGPQVYIGSNGVAPSAREFTLHMRDRHGMAWADYDGDARLDVFIARGALSGSLTSLPIKLWDALFEQRAGGMTDIGPSVLPDKRGCPARQVGWVDFDGDGMLDVFIVCGRGGFPSQLLRQQADGRFVDVAAEVGLHLATEGKFLWLDIDADGHSDLVWVDELGAYVFRNNAGRFTQELLTRFESDPAVTGLRIGDLDGDGNPDIFVESPTDSRVLLSDGHDLHVKAASELGLPRRSLAATWVDLDNDGVQELFSVPDGIYRRNADGKFSPTGTLAWKPAMTSPYELADAMVAWPDLNGDGARDLVLATNLRVKPASWAVKLSRVLGRFGDPRMKVAGTDTRLEQGYWDASMFINPPRKNHWLQVNLIGGPGNPQAIGARVRVRAGDLEQTQVVGHAENSRYSQGHYRVYFGLGRKTRLDALTVVWPDGMVQDMVAPAIDRLVTISRADSSGSPKAMDSDMRRPGLAGDRASAVSYHPSSE